MPLNLIWNWVTYGFNFPVNAVLDFKIISYSTLYIKQLFFSIIALFWPFCSSLATYLENFSDWQNVMVADRVC